MIRKITTCLATAALMALAGCKAANMLSNPVPVQVFLTSGPQNGQTVASGNISYTWTGKENFVSDYHDLPSDLLYSYQADNLGWSPWIHDVSANYYVNTSGTHTFSVKARTPGWAVSDAATATFKVNLPGGVPSDTIPPNSAWDLAVEDNSSTITASVSSGIAVLIRFRDQDNATPPSGLRYGYTLDGRGLYPSLTPRTDNISTEIDGVTRRIVVDSFLYQASFQSYLWAGAHYIDLFCWDDSNNVASTRVLFSTNGYSN